MESLSAAQDVVAGQQGEMQQPESILLVYQRTRGEVQRACALSGIRRHHVYNFVESMETFRNRLSRITNEQQRAYWQGYLDPLGGISLILGKNLRFWVSYSHHVYNHFEIVI